MQNGFHIIISKTLLKKILQIRIELKFPLIYTTYLPILFLLAFTQPQRAPHNVELLPFHLEAADPLHLTHWQRSLPSLNPQKRWQRQHNYELDLRFDNIDHWCIFLNRTGKRTCKLPGCKSDTQAYCMKCKLNLCNSRVKSCFLTFHKRQ